MGLLLCSGVPGRQDVTGGGKLMMAGESGREGGIQPDGVLQ